MIHASAHRSGRFSLRWIASLTAALLLAGAPATVLQAQQTYIPSPQELDQLLAPIALYPDALLAQITTASTNPQEILDVDDWLHQNSNLRGVALTSAAQGQGFDPAFIALVNFPQVLDMMAQNIDDYAAIGAAFAADPASVSDSVQRLRQMAYDSGALRSTPQQSVIVEPYDGGQTILIQPANPDVVYLPRYNPGMIYDGMGLSPGYITFGVGIGLGAGLAPAYPWGWSRWGWNWGGHAILYNRVIWAPRYNRYRARHAYRPRRPNYANRPAIRPRPPQRVRPSIQPRPAPNRSNRPTAKPGNRPRPAAPPSRRDQKKRRSEPAQPHQ